MKTIFEEEKVRKSHHVVNSYACCGFQKRAASKSRRPSLWRVYWRAYWPMIVLGGVFKLFADLIIYIPPILLDYMVQYVARETENLQNENSTLHVR
jgi:hypothetical protein